MASVGPILLKYFDNDLHPLSDEEAINLVKQDGGKIDYNVKQQLFRGCVRLATVMARNFHTGYYGHNIDFDDFLQEAYQTIWTNVAQWDRNYSLKTFISFKIKNALSTLVRNNTGPIKLSDRFWRKVRQLERLTIDYDSELTKSEQIEILFKPFGYLGDVLNAKRATKAESIYSEFDDCAIKEIDKDYRIELSGNHYCLADIEKLLNICVKDKRRIELFAKRYGLFKYKQCTLPELQELYNMTYREAQYQIDLAVKEMNEYVNPIDRTRKCIICGNKFEPARTHPNAQTCSRKCSKKSTHLKSLKKKVVLA